jgi:hypothetical protein
MLGLVAEVAVAGLRHAALSPDDRADFYDGLSAFLPKMESEAAKYAATCLREAQRAQQDFLVTFQTRKGGV